MHREDEVTMGDIPIEDESPEVQTPSPPAQVTPALGIRFSNSILALNLFFAISPHVSMVFFFPFLTLRYLVYRIIIL